RRRGCGRLPAVAGRLAPVSPNRVTLTGAGVRGAGGQRKAGRGSRRDGGGGGWGRGVGSAPGGGCGRGGVGGRGDRRGGGPVGPITSSAAGRSRKIGGCPMATCLRLACIGLATCACLWLVRPEAHADHKNKPPEYLPQKLAFQIGSLARREWVEWDGKE